jgi:peptide/nickel transport system permease protein
VIKKLLRRPLFAAAFAVIAVLVLLAIAPSLFAPHDPLAQSLTDRLKGPTWSHPFGTDEFGRDVLSRVIYGTRISLLMGVIVVVLGTLLGGVLGAIAGYRGGRIDELLMRFTDVFFAFPPMLLPMMVVVVLQPSLVNTAIALVITWWPAYARLVRGQVLSVKQLGYVESARVLGVSPWRLLRRHILPNSISPVIVMATMDVGFAILTAAGLGFLGLGAQPPTAEWGAMTSAGLGTMLTAWWAPLFPGLAIAIVVLVFNLLGDELQTAIDPRGEAPRTVRRRRWQWRRPGAAPAAEPS